MDNFYSLILLPNPETGKKTTVMKSWKCVWSSQQRLTSGWLLLSPQAPSLRRTRCGTMRCSSSPCPTWVWATTSCRARRSRTPSNSSSPTTRSRLCRKVRTPWSLCVSVAWERLRCLELLLLYNASLRFHGDGFISVLVHIPSPHLSPSFLLFLCLALMKAGGSTEPCCIRACTDMCRPISFSADLEQIAVVDAAVVLAVEGVLCETSCW